MSFLLDQQQLEFENIPIPIQIVHYNPAEYNPNLFEEAFSINPPEQLRQWVKKRQAQFLAGRIAAKNALSFMNLIDQSVAIGKHREPIWSKGIVGSISHSNNFSIAAVLNKTNMIKGLGIDIQEVIKQKEKERIQDIILSSQDQLLFHKIKKNVPENYLLTLIFSAKESFFKAVFPEVKKYFNFNEVSVQSVSPENKQLSLVSNSDATFSYRIKCDVYYDFLQLNHQNFSHQNLKHKKNSVITYCVNKQQQNISV